MLSNVIINAPPARIQAAMEFLRFCDQRQNPAPLFDGVRPEPRDLSSLEQKTYDTAIELIRSYFTSDIEVTNVVASSDSNPPRGPCSVLIG